MAKKRMPGTVRTALRDELAAARQASDADGRWTHLERAHILSQPWAWPHVDVHGRMLGQALLERNRKEAIGQIIRLVVAGPGSLAGRYPEGNNGRATVPMTQAAPIPADLASILGASA